MQNRLNRLVSLILLTSVILCGCSKKSDQGSQSNGSRQFLSLGTAPPGGAFFVVGSAIAEVVQAHTENTGWQITAEATKGTQENIHRLDKSEIDFALANAAITFFAVRGQGRWDRVYPIQSVITLAPNIALFITPTNSGIKTIADLQGKRVVIGPAGAGFEYFVGPILEAHGLSFNDIQPLNDTQAGAVALLADGSADAAFLGGAVPTASITQACASQDIRFLQFDEVAKDRLVADYPFFERKTIPANTYKGQTDAFQCLNVGSMILVTGASVSDDMVYQFTKTLYEHAPEVVEKHPAGRAINPMNAVLDTGTPFHPGAVRYYKEIGIWKKD
jgi:TRAP transporter TAXI family solute receptor